MVEEVESVKQHLSLKYGYRVLVSTLIVYISPYSGHLSLSCL